MLMEHLQKTPYSRSDNDSSIVEIGKHTKKEKGRTEGKVCVYTHNRILEKIIQRKPLMNILSEICEWVEHTHPEIFCSILLVQNGILHVGARGRLPASYVQLYEGCEIGPMVASCGTAVYRRAPVIVTDLQESPLWDNFREKALGHGLRSCWSSPIPSTRNDRILGTVDLYCAEPQSPTPQDWELLELLSHVAGLAIEHDQTWTQETETEIKFEKILEHAQEMVALCARDTGKITEISKPLAEKLGYPKEEIIGRTLMELAHPESQKQVQETWNQLQTTGRVHKAVLTCGQSQGSTMTVVLNASAVYGQQKELLYYHTHWQEITEYMKTEEGVWEEEHAFRSIIEAIPQQVWTAQPDGALDYVNQRVTTYFDRTVEEIIGWNWQGIVHPDDLPKIMEMWHRAIQAGDPYEVEFRLLRGEDKAYLWHLARAVPIKDEHGKVLKWLGTNTNITQRKSIEDALRTSEERYRSVAQSAPDGIISADSQGRITSWNKGAKAQFGYEEDEIVGCCLTELMPERYRKAHQEGLTKVQQKEACALRNQTRELVGLRKDGSEFPIERGRGRGRVCLLWNNSRYYRTERSRTGRQKSL
jgi:PAS domain S-box-containing protein